MPVNRLTRRLLPALGGAMLLITGGALTAAAQQGPGGPPPSIQQMAADRMAMLKQELQITPAEEPAWDRFSQLSVQNAAQLDQMFRQRAQQVPSMNAVQNLQTFADLQLRQARNFQQVVPAFQRLYSQLSPQQRQAADEAFRSMGEARGNPPPRG